MKTTRRTYPEIPHNPEEPYYPLSFQQERVLYLNQLLPEGTLWNRISCKRLKGTIDVPLLKRAVEDLIKRHTVLGTKLSFIGNNPVQSVPPSLENVFQFVEHPSATESSGGRQTRDLLNQEYRIPMRVNGGRLFKVTLMKTGESDYMLILKLHHIISDATSFQILWNDLKSIYNAYFNGKGALPRLEVNYHDYALWQRSIFDEPNTAEQESYWLDRFSGDLPVLDLPVDFPPPSRISFRGALEKSVLPEGFIKRLESFSLKNRVVLFSTLLSAYYLLLQRYCHQDDLVVGTVLSGRHYSPAIRNVAGFFVNTVAIRMQTDDKLTAEQWVKQVHEHVVDAHMMQDYPFDRLVRKIDPERGNSRNPLFRAMFNLVTTYRERMGFAGIDSETWMEPEIDSTQVDLFLDVHVNPGQPEVRIEYNTDIFIGKTIKRILNHYINLLCGIVDTPGARVGELDMLAPDERNRLIVEWNEPRAAYPQNQCVHELFEKQVETTPDRTALMFRGDRMTYRQLNERSNQVARTLRKNGVTAGQIVGVMLDRSFEMIIALMAVLKAGGAYLPIEPDCPRDRIGYMFADSGARLFLVREPAGDKGREKVGGQTVKTIEVNEDDSFSEDRSNLGRMSQPSDLAYVIYTSGSTGRPKGVMVEHRSIVNTLSFLQDAYPLMADDTYLLKTTYTFDVSVAELFGWFFDGGALAVLEPGAEKDPARIVRAVESYGVTHMNFVPSMLDVFLDVIRDTDIRVLKELKYVIAAGEALKPALADKFHAMIDGVRLENLYGPTESSIYGTVYSLNRLEKITDVPIGKPITNMRAYILDDRNEIQPVGVVGELCLAGIGLARGYLNRPELTDEKFVPDPFRPGEKMYRTGDLVKWMDDGNIRYCGRIDHQVKIRGFRVELGEIEKSLVSHPAVGEAVAVASGNHSDRIRLNAFMVMNRDMDIADEELRQYLGKWLPGYMVPTAFVRLERMPLNSSGKVDRKALPAPHDPIRPRPAHQAPVTAVERKLIDITEHILNIKGLDVNSNFFELGGNSLLTIRFVAEIEEAFKVNLAIIDFIDLPKISQIARKIDPHIRPEIMQALE